MYHSLSCYNIKYYILQRIVAFGEYIGSFHFVPAYFMAFSFLVIL